MSSSAGGAMQRPQKVTVTATTTTPKGGAVSKSVISNERLLEIRQELLRKDKAGKAWEIAEVVEKETGTRLNESTIRGRFIEMGNPLSGRVHIKREGEDPSNPGAVTERGEIGDVYESAGKLQADVDLQYLVPTENAVGGYLERKIDNRLAIHYNAGKYPITQGKQGSGKTFGHCYYAYKMQLPFLLISCYEDFALRKLYGEKTIVNGSIVFKESVFVKATQSPCVILFDEINAVSNKKTFDFHALLQNRELFVKDADNGNGKIYKLHPECRIGFAQNPKSAKYIGGNIKPSNFLGRCTFITYPNFRKSELRNIVRKRYPKITSQDSELFVTYYDACIKTIDKSQLPLDISIRQLLSVIDLWMSGMELEEALEDGLIGMLDAVSQPKSKEAFKVLAKSVWKGIG